MKKEELRIINTSIGQLNALKRIKEEEIRKEKCKSEKEIEDEVDCDCGEVEKISFEERKVLGKELERLIYVYSRGKNCEYGYRGSDLRFEDCSIAYSRKLFQDKIFELSYVIIIKYMDVNEKYFSFRNIEKLIKIVDRILRIDYRREKESMVRIKALIKFCEID